jgi:hypothetical protein
MLRRRYLSWKVLNRAKSKMNNGPLTNTTRNHLSSLNNLYSEWKTRPAFLLLESLKKKRRPSTHLVHSFDASQLEIPKSEPSWAFSNTFLKQIIQTLTKSEQPTSPQIRNIVLSSNKKFRPIKALNSGAPKWDMTNTWRCVGTSLRTFALLQNNNFLVRYLVGLFLTSTPSPSSTNFIEKFSYHVQHQLSSYFDSDRLSRLKTSNLWAVPTFNYTLRRKLLRYGHTTNFDLGINLWYYRVLTRFIENCTGRKVAIRFGPSIEQGLTFGDLALCNTWVDRVLGFQKILGQRIFAVEGLHLVVLAIRLKDPMFLANWIRAMLERMSFWKYRLLFRYLKFMLRHLFRLSFPHFQFKGLKLRLKGKISVAGNARTRTLHLRVGNTSHSSMSNRIAYDLSFINTFTGVLGFKLWFFY